MENSEVERDGERFIGSVSQRGGASGSLHQSLWSVVIFASSSSCVNTLFSQSEQNWLMFLFLNILRSSPVFLMLISRAQGCSIVFKPIQPPGGQRNRAGTPYTIKLSVVF